jgi:hypothetical protein
MVDPVELGRVFYGHHIPDVLNHADNAVVPAGIGADFAMFVVGNIPAGKAINDSFSHCDHCSTKGFNFRGILLEEMKRHPKGGLPADTREFGQFCDRTLK